MTNQEAPRRMMSEKQILDLLPIARSTFQNWEKSGQFPKSVQIGEIVRPGTPTKWRHGKRAARQKRTMIHS